MEKQLESKALCAIEVELEPPQEIGNTPRGIRRIWQVAGGRVDGERLKGQILPGGSDWALLRSDGVVDLDIRVTILTSDGQLIAVSAKGLVDMPPDLRKKVREGQSVDPSKYYFRDAYFFETSSEKYAWLNKILGVGAFELTATGVSGTVYEIR
jgi:hypothetical protein